MQPVERMKSLLDSLPNKDRIIASSLIEERKFEDLWDIVTSAIYKVRKHEERYPETNLADMNVLKSELSLYLDQLDINNEEELEDGDLMLDEYEEY